MTSVVAQSELTKKALAWVCDQRDARPGVSVGRLIEEAGQRFNLGPLDEEFLKRFLSEQARSGK